MKPRGVGLADREDLIDAHPRGRIKAPPAGGPEPEVDDDTVPVVGLLTQGRPHVDCGARPDQPHDRGHLAAGRAAEADPPPRTCSP